MGSVRASPLGFCDVRSLAAIIFFHLDLDLMTVPGERSPRPGLNAGTGDDVDLGEAWADSNLLAQVSVFHTL